MTRIRLRSFHIWNKTSKNYFSTQFHLKNAIKIIARILVSTSPCLFRSTNEIVNWKINQLLFDYERRRTFSAINTLYNLSRTDASSMVKRKKRKKKKNLVINCPPRLFPIKSESFSIS